MTAKPDDTAIAAVLRDLARERGVAKSFCPSEAARALAAANWRSLMPDVRRVAADLSLRATQKGIDVNLLTARGPIRLSLARNPQEPD